ncbi:MAG: cellulase family glycosylhydrolase [Bacteroidetes bacterium]|nr:MAG: cellulase family glycosylhydrolase [Bacteroidota bacterium]
MMTLRTLLLLTAALCTAHAQNAPFSRGVNLTNWFQEASPRQIQFSKYTKKDFADIKALGCDVIRLPVNLHAMTSGAPLYTPDPLFLGMLDQAVNWAEELGLHIIIDNHTFDPAVDTPVNIYTVLVPVWKQMAAHLKGRSTLVHYEVLNEPHGINEHLWNTIQKMVIDTIRSVDTKHTIIVGPANWNALSSLAGMPAYADTNLIYTFHFYDPFLFTHQGASWASPSLVPLAGMPFPYDAARMPALPDTLKGTWIQDSYNGYAVTGTNAAVTSTLDDAAAFRTARNVPLLCGELGVFIPNSPDSDRVRWYGLVRSRLEQHGIAWTMWDYQGGFGLFRNGTAEQFEHDVNVPLVSALGLTVPPQTPYVKRPDSVSVVLYDDYAGPRLRTYFDGAYADLYSTQAPHRGTYALRFGDAPQYTAVQFKFVPEKDLSRLRATGATLKLHLRSSSPNLAFDLRFVDTKTGPADRPWRMRKTISSATVPWDGQWHELSIPLGSFTEHGAWDNGWYDPVGEFDWTSVSHFEIVSEQSSLAGKTVFFDDVYIYPNFPGSVADASLPSAFALFQNHPNPFNPVTTIAYSVPHDGAVTLTVYDLLGREVSVLFSGFARAGHHTASFDASHLSSGVYLYRLTSGSFSAARKMVLQR